MLTKHCSPIKYLPSIYSPIILTKHCTHPPGPTKHCTHPPALTHHYTHTPSIILTHHYTPLWQVLSARVVIATLSTASRLHVVPGVRRGHFGAVVIDEAGHALEPEAVAPVATLLGLEGQLILAGDPKQLGPNVHSEAARTAGLGVSLLERLVRREAYTADLLQVEQRVARGGGGSGSGGSGGGGGGSDGGGDEWRVVGEGDATSRCDAGGGGGGSGVEGGGGGGDGRGGGIQREAYNPLTMTKLLRNFRAHGALLEVPNALFYGGELEACADRMVSHSLVGWGALPQPTVPMLFHGVVGRDQREASSPSWFNADEAAVVIDYVEQLLRWRQSRLTADQIGIITPFNKQAHKISKLLRSRGHVRASGGVKVTCAVPTLTPTLPPRS